MDRADSVPEEAGSEDATWHPDGFLLVSDLLGEGRWPRNPLGAQILAVDQESGAVSAYGSGVPAPLGSTITPDGEATPWVESLGTGEAGSQDGPLEEATFNYPNGITASPDGTRLFVQQLDRRLRVISRGAGG